MSSIIAPHSYKIQPNGSVIVGHGLFNKWKKHIHGINPVLYKRLVKVRAVPKGKVKGMGKNGSSIYKVGGGAYVMGGGLFGRIFRAVKRGVHKVGNALEKGVKFTGKTAGNIAKTAVKGAVNTVKNEAVRAFNDIKKIRKPSDLLMVADNLKSRAQRLTSGKFWRKQARNAGLKKIGLGKKKRRKRHKTRGGSRRMLGAGNSGNYARAPGKPSTAILT